MNSTILTKASRQSFNRPADEIFEDLSSLHLSCSNAMTESTTIWANPNSVRYGSKQLILTEGTGKAYDVNGWSYSQLCDVCGLDQSTVDKVSESTRSACFRDMLMTMRKPLQLFIRKNTHVLSVHSTAYTRLHDVELLDVVRDAAPEFTRPQTSMTGGTGLYRGEQDMFCFLIDPSGWIEIEGEHFAPGFFVWNSEVGRRSLGMQSFWFQRICRNHIVWGARDVTEYRHKHTTNVVDGLSIIRAMIDGLKARRDKDRDSFANVIKKAMTARVGSTSDDALKFLTGNKIPAGLAKRAMEIAASKGAFTIWSLVDALTQLSQESEYAGTRTEKDMLYGQLLSLALAA